MRQAGRRAAEAERLELGSMTGGLAHEIKNPLSTVVLNAQLLREEIEDSSMDGEIADRVTRRTLALQREAERLRRSADFLQFAGRVKLAPPRPTCGWSSTSWWTSSTHSARRLEC